MLIAVPFFGSDPRWLRLLEHWFELHAASGTRVPAIVITDEQSLPGFPVLCVDTTAWRSVIRSKDGQPHPWDRKGAIVAAALPILGRFLSCDVDAFIQRDPEPWLAKLDDVPISGRADGWQRTVLEARQINAGVLWFGYPKTRPQLASDYGKAFHTLNEEYSDDEWLEQLAWSLLCYRYNAPTLPAELNWSHHVKGVEAAAIIHEHGPTKWRRIE
jgi:hypothetical protein